MQGYVANHADNEASDHPSPLGAFVAYEGLRRYGFHVEADQLAGESETEFLVQWRGGRKATADPRASMLSNGLLALIALEARERKAAA